jgi:hypothetical protein
VRDDLKGELVGLNAVGHFLKIIRVTLDMTSL